VIGDAPKNYLTFGSGETRAYIAKKPRREGPIECVTEYLIARIGASLPLRVAEGRLAQLPVKRGDPPDVRFLSRQFLNRAAKEQLVHGSQLVAGCFEIQDQELYQQIGGNEWQFYTVDLVDEVLRSTTKAKDEQNRLTASLCRMMAFDSLIGANDRHAQNWGVVQGAVEAQPARFAPIFDTARGLFWNYGERRLKELDEAGRRNFEVEKYANGSMPLIGIQATTRPNHFDVIAYMVQNARYRPSVCQVVGAFSPDRMARLLHLEFRHLLTRRRLEYIEAVLRLRHQKLMRICGLA